MATTSGNLTMRNGGRYGRRAKLLAGLAALGCAAALAFGGLRPSDTAQTPPAASALTAPAPASSSEQRFLEWNLQFPTGTLPGAIATQEQQRFLEQNHWLPEVPAALPITQQRFLELNTVLPAAPANP